MATASGTRDLQQLGVNLGGIVDVNIDLGAALGISLQLGTTVGINPVRGGGLLNLLPSLPALDPSSLVLPALPIRQSGNGISYRGGNIMTNPTVYLIYYGNWAPSNVGPDAQDIITNFVQNYAGSPLYRIATGYWDQQNFVQQVHGYGGSYSDPGSEGTVLTLQNMVKVIAKAVKAGAFPLDFNGIYAILGAPEIDTDYNGSFGSCSNYCAFHTNFGAPGKQIKYTFVGNTAQKCYSACTATPTPGNGPNGNPAIDSMVSILAHELVETVTDPLGSTWYDDNKAEVADKCVYNYVLNPTLATIPSGAAYNMIIGSRPYLIQGLWVNSLGGSCGIIAPY
ncbi:hypothetical protein WJX72_001184 [[Myrmecia] bisecta]|uniref:Uncharacterized protein n=1 Tax=[Myrmecia] bisecta TaxID=41462 RepID=A0AAW1PJ75_9CHLO